MPSGNLDAGVRAEDLDAAFAPKAAPKIKNPLAGLTKKQQKEVKAPVNPTKITKSDT